MANKSYKNGAARIVFLIGTSEEGKAIRKSKSFQHISENVSTNNLYDGLSALASLSAYDVLEMNYIETSSITQS